MLRAGGPDEKEQMVRTMNELKVVVHEVVSPAGLLEAKNAPMERKKKRSERTKERLHRTKGGKWLLFLPSGGLKSDIFDA